MVRLNLPRSVFVAGLAVAGWAQLRSAGSGDPALSGRGSRFGEMELSGEGCRHAGQAAGTEYRSAGAALLPG